MNGGQNMALPKIEAVVTADTAQAEAGFDRVERGLDDMSGAADRAATRTARIGTQMRNTGGKSSALGRNIQNAAFQMGDFAVQVGSGTSASIALGQQLPQLLGGFGILGAVLGAVVAVAIPLTKALRGLSASGTDMTVLFGSLQPAAAAVAASFKQITVYGIQMAEVILNNLDRIVITAGVVAGFFAGKWLIAFAAARVATFSLAGALTFLRGALIRTGIGALIIGAGELVYQFTRLSKAAGGVGEAIGLIKDVFVEVWERIKTVAAAGIDYLIGQFQRMQAGWVNSLAHMAGAISDFFFNLGEGVRGSGIPMLDEMANGLASVAANVGRAGGSMSRTAMGLSNAADASLKAASGGFADATAPLESVQKIKDVLASIKDERITLPDLLGTGTGAEDGDGGAGGGKKTAAEKLDEELTAQEERIKDHFGRIKALTMGGLSDKLGAWGDYFSNLVSMTGTENEKLFRVAKAAKAGQALMDAWGAYTQVLSDPSFIGRPWARAAAAGQVLAAGLGAVNAIKGVSSSGSGASYGGGSISGGGSTSAQPVPQQQVANITLHGDTHTTSSVIGLFEQINEGLGQGYRINGIVA